MKRQKTVDAYTCDCCGAEIDDKARAYITVSFNGEVWYEWWVCGDYCNECGELLANAIAESIQLPERCSKDFRDKDARVKAEVEMIEEHEEWIDSYHPEYEKMPRELSKTSVLNSIRSARVLLLRLYKMIEEDE